MRKTLVFIIICGIWISCSKEKPSESEVDPFQNCPYSEDQDIGGIKPGHRGSLIVNNKEYIHWSSNYHSHNFVSYRRIWAKSDTVEGVYWGKDISVEETEFSIQAIDSFFIMNSNQIRDVPVWKAGKINVINCPGLRFHLKLTKFYHPLFVDGQWHETYKALAVFIIATEIDENGNLICISSEIRTQGSYPEDHIFTPLKKGDIFGKLDGEIVAIKCCQMPENVSTIIWEPYESDELAHYFIAGRFTVNGSFIRGDGELYTIKLDNEFNYIELLPIVYFWPF